MDRDKLLKLKEMNKEIFREIMSTCMKINNEIVTLKEYSKSNPDNPILKIEEDKLMERYVKVVEILFKMDYCIENLLKENKENKDE